MNLVVQFSMSCAFRCIALRLAAYLLYHFVVCLSRGFSNFFQVFSSSRLSPTLRCRSLAAPIVYHILPRLSTPFCKFFQDFSIFPAGKVTALGFGRLFCFLQCGIPHRSCRFYWLLAGAVGKRQGIAIPYPSPTPLLTPGGSAAAGHICAAAVDRDIGYWYPVLSLLANSEFGLGGCVRAMVVRVSVGLPSWYRTFFIIGGRDCLFLRLREVLLFLS